MARHQNQSTRQLGGRLCSWLKGEKNNKSLQSLQLTCTESTTQDFSSLDGSFCISSMLWVRHTANEVCLLERRVQEIAKFQTVLLVLL